MSFTLVNFFNTTLSAASSSTATTFTVSSSTNLPTLASGEVLPITLNDAATRLVFEICYVTGISGNVLTVERAQEGTSAQNWNVGDFIWNGPTAGTALLQNTVDAFTTSGLITASGGLTTGTIAGSPNFSGGLTIPNATANNEPAALGQVLNSSPATAGGTNVTSTSQSITTPSFTAPSNGVLLLLASIFFSAVAGSTSTSSVTASLGALSGQAAFGSGSTGLSSIATIPMSAGQSTTFTVDWTWESSQYSSSGYTMIFIPTP